MVEFLLLFTAFVIALSTTDKTRLFSPGGAFSIYAFLSMLTFYVVTSFEFQQKILFTAMPLYGLQTVAKATLTQYLFLVVLGKLASFGIPSISVNKQPRQSVRTFRNAERFINGWGAALVIYALAILTLINFLEIDKSLLWHNRTYLTIASPEAMGITNTMGRIFYFGMRPIGLVLFSLSIYYYFTRNILLFSVCLVISGYILIIMLAGSSRWAPLYFLSAFLSNAYLRRRMFSALNILLLSLMFISFLMVLIGRNEPDQGLSQIFNNLAQISSSSVWPYLGGFVVNVTEGATSFANTMLIDSNHAPIYKNLSFSPLPSIIDGFSEIQEFSQIRISVYVPMSAIGEAYKFGVGYMVLFYTGIFIWLRTTTRLFLKNSGPGALLITIISYWLIFTLHTYPIRTTWRYIIIVTAISFLVQIFTKNRLKRQRAQKRH